MDIYARAATVEASIQAAELEQKRLKGKLEQTRNDVQDYQEASTVLTYLAEQLSQDAEKQTAELATVSLQESFSDQDLSLETRHTVLRNQPAVELLLVDRDKQVQDNPLDSFGGGPCSLVGMIVRIITILRRKNLARMLILDEPTAQVSEEYSSPVAEFLRKACTSVDQVGLGFSSLTITHSRVLAGQAHKVYRASLGQDGYLTLEEENVSG